uniref:Delta-like protein n=1 Tax=Steinernema glaseri TaxID=37863 RepID=A0A1I8AAK5_9BILA
MSFISSRLQVTLLLFLLSPTVADIASDLKNMTYKQLLRQAGKKGNSITYPMYVLWEQLCLRNFPDDIYPDGVRPPPEAYIGSVPKDGNCAKDDDELESTTTKKTTTKSPSTTSKSFSISNPCKLQKRTGFLSTVGIPVKKEPTPCPSSCNEFAKCEVESSTEGVCDKCACPLGRTGACCEMIVDLCADEEMNPCKDDSADMHRTCTVSMPVGNTKCACDPGWIGRNCTVEFDPCEERPCKNGAECVVTEEGDFFCDCTYEFKGRYCETCPQMADTCQHNSTCWPGLSGKRNDYKCICQRGYTGRFCETPIPCIAYNPCQNGGECYLEEGTAVCECLSIWTGRFCEVFDICHDDKCENGICHPLSEKNYSCSCWKGFTGANCEIKIDECDPNPCWYNMSCIDKVGDFECMCLPGTSGRLCEN